ncbi:MAG TPA: hypothetical protein VN541_18330 [Tepidisphaeraceae bacterium]|nr:hypothetical protein [Tepidisphaeraceae bacterium]
MSDLPPEVDAFHSALRRLAAIEQVDTGLKSLATFGPETFSWPGEFGDLPHALLRRSNGGLPEEAWANTEIVLTRDEAGWLTLEFLAWWVRDQSRGGELIQMRPMGLPPKAYDVQLGRTLKFIIDHFAICPDDPSPMLKILKNRAANLSLSIDLYKDFIGSLIRVAL